MHILHLLRHAKTVVGEDMDDRDRPLTRGGRETARRIGESLPGALGTVDLVLCSSAVRTCQTFELIIARFSPHPPVVFEDGLYLASAASLLQRLRRLDEGRGAVLVIGHNPGLHELAMALASPESAQYGALAAGKFPTSARASFAIASAWSGLAQGRQPLLDYVTPKSLGVSD